MRPDRQRPLVWLADELKTPPLSREARIELGVLLRRLQAGESLGLPHSRPMPAIGPRCHELRVSERDLTWRVIYRLNPEAIVLLDVFAKKSAATPKEVIDRCRRRLRRYEAESGR